MHSKIKTLINNCLFEKRDNKVTGTSDKVETKITFETLLIGNPLCFNIAGK